LDDCTTEEGSIARFRRPRAESITIMGQEGERKPFLWKESEAIPALEGFELGRLLQSSKLRRCPQGVEVWGVKFLLEGKKKSQLGERIGNVVFEEEV